jgi:hypothetical protein
MSNLAVWICAISTMACGFVDRSPDVDDVQSAYEREAPANAATHIRGLKVRGLQCERTSMSNFFCQVGYTITDQTGGRVYIDGASLQRSSTGDWKLKSGLCTPSL